MVAEPGPRADHRGIVTIPLLPLPAPRRSAPGGLLAALLAVALGCAWAGPPRRDPALAYRLAGSGDHWDVVGEDRVFEDVSSRYPEFFAIVLDPTRNHDINLRRLRDDLEHQPADRRNYDALNALAIGFFELNYRAESRRGSFGYLRTSYRATHILAVPWRAYGEVSEPELRDAILDFFEDVASGEKLGTARTAGRLIRIVESLERKEPDAARAARIRDLGARLRAAVAADGGELPPGP